MGIGLCLCGLLAVNVFAETFELADGKSVTGDIVSFNENGLQLNVGGGKYERVPWQNFSQADLKKLKEKPKIAPLVEPFIEIPKEDRLKKTEVVIKPPERLDLPAKGSLLAALFGSSVCVIALLLIYAANIYAGYEIATVRAYPPALVCGISAVVPVVGPILFLCLPTRIISAEEYKPGESRAAAQAVAEAAQAAATAEAAEGATAYPPPEAAEAKPALPQTQVFQRGKFTFNRRFFETKFPGFFGMVRRDTEKDMVLLFKTARGEHIASRISRIAASDLHIEVRKGSASQEVGIPFLEIQEIQLKHKDA